MQNDAISPWQLAPKLPEWNPRKYRWAPCIIGGFPTHPQPPENNPAQVDWNPLLPCSNTDSPKQLTVI
jgi:hypothetical protein